LYEECLDLSRELYQARSPSGYGSLLHNLGYIALHEGDSTRASTLFHESLGLFQQRGEQRGIAECLIGLGSVAAATAQPERAVCLFGAAEAALGRLNVHPSPSNRASYERSLAFVRTRLSRATFAAAWQSGRTLSLDQAVVDLAAPGVAIAADERRFGQPGAQHPTDHLTPREREVAQLVANGLTNRHIAETLVITVATAERHIANIREKLGFTSRAQIAAWFVGTHLVERRPAPTQPS
jgi:non-specific serine/threonine protein kinase